MEARRRAARLRDHLAPPRSDSSAAAEPPPPAEVRGAAPVFDASEYHSAGFTGPLQLFSAAEAEGVRRSFDAALQAAADGEGERTPNGTLLLSRTDGPPTTHPRTWDDTLPLARKSELLDRCAEILGPDLVLWATVFWHKPPRTTKYIPW